MAYWAQSDATESSVTEGQPQHPNTDGDIRGYWQLRSAPVHNDGPLEAAIICLVLQVEADRQLQGQERCTIGVFMHAGGTSSAGAARQPAGSLVAHLEVQLHGCTLELAAQRVIHGDVDLGA